MSASVNYKPNTGCNFKAKIIEEYTFSAKYIDEYSFSALIYNLANVLGLHSNIDMVFVTDIANSCFSNLKETLSVELGMLSISEKNKLNTFLKNNLDAGLFSFDSASSKIALEQLANIELNDININLDEHATVSIHDDISVGVFLSKIISAFLADVKANIDCGFFDSKIKANIANTLNGVVNIGFLNIFSDENKSEIHETFTFNLFSLDIRSQKYALLGSLDSDLLSQCDKQTLYDIENLFSKCFPNAIVKSKSQIDHGVFYTNFSMLNKNQTMFNVDLGSCKINPLFSLFINESSTLSFNDVSISAILQSIYRLRAAIGAILNNSYLAKVFINDTEQINIPSIRINTITTLGILTSLYVLDDHLLDYYDSMTLDDTERSIIS